MEKVMRTKQVRVLSILLSLMLVFGTMCAVPAFAGESAEDFTIGSIDDLYYLESLVEDRVAGSANAPSVGVYNVTLMTDLDLSGMEWDGIGIPQSFIGFSGTFDGNGHTITVELNNSANVGPKGGLFNLTYNAAVTDLTVTGTVSSTRFVGGLVGRVMGNFTASNCNIDGMTLSLSNGANNSVGGLIGQCGSGGGGGTGGGTGSSGGTQGTVSINGGTITGNFVSTSSTNPVGGVFGHIYSGYNASVTGVTMNAALTGQITGLYAGNNASNLTLTNCSPSPSVAGAAGVNTGTITINLQ